MLLSLHFLSVLVPLAYTPSLVSSPEFVMFPIRGHHFSKLLDSHEPQIEGVGLCELNRAAFGLNDSDSESRVLRF